MSVPVPGPPPEGAGWAVRRPARARVGRPGRRKRPTLVVVGAAILDAQGRRVLAAQRTAPARVAGLWEFPGGKVESGEEERAAVARECREELSVEVEVLERLADEVPVIDGIVLRVWTARIVRGIPVASEHGALRWLGPEDLRTVAWLPADQPLLEPLEALLRALPDRGDGRGDGPDVL